MTYNTKYFLIDRSPEQDHQVAISNAYFDRVVDDGGQIIDEEETYNFYYNLGLSLNNSPDQWAFYEAEILESGFAGDAQELTGTGGDSIVIGQEGSDYDDIIRPKYCNLNLVIEKGQESIIKEFREFFVASDRQFAVIVKEKFQLFDEVCKENILFRGYLLPDEYQEQWKLAPNRVQLAANDGLSQLQNDFLNSYSGRVKASDLIHEIFSKLDDIVYTSQFWIRDLGHESNFDTDLSPQSQFYVDRSNYTEKSNEGEGEDMNCFEILKALCKWKVLYITKDTFEHGGSVDHEFALFERSALNFGGTEFRRIDQGADVEGVSFDTGVEITLSDKKGLFPVLNDHTFNLEDPVNQVKIESELKKKTGGGNLIPNGNFYDLDLSGGYNNIGVPEWVKGGNIDVNYPIISRTSPTVTANAVELVGDHFNDYLEMENPVYIREESVYKFRFVYGYREGSPFTVFGDGVSRIGPIFIEISLAGDDGVQYWLTDNSNSPGRSWESGSLTPQNRVIKIQPDNIREMEETTFELEQPVSGDFSVRIYAPDDFIVYETEEGGTNQTSFPGVVYIGPIELTVDEFNISKRVKDHSNSNTNFGSKILEKEIIHIDDIPRRDIGGPEEGFSPATVTFINNNGDHQATSSWERSPFISKDLMSHFAELILQNFRRTLMRLEGSFYNRSRIHSFLFNFQVPDRDGDRNAIVRSGEISLGEATINMTLEEVLDYLDVDPLQDPDKPPIDTLAEEVAKDKEADGKNNGVIQDRRLIPDQYTHASNYVEVQGSDINRTGRTVYNNISTSTEQKDGSEHIIEANEVHVLDQSGDIFLAAINNIDGKKYTIKNDQSYTLKAQNGETINGDEDYSVSAGESVTLVSKNNDWKVI